MYPKKQNARFFLKNAKVLIAVLFILITTNTAIAQKKVERFCRLDVIFRTETKSKIFLNYGDKQDFLALNDSTTLVNLEKVNNFNNDIDAINYMTKLGWSYTKTAGLGQFRYECFFRKIYDATK
jgi:hypothetical protein